MDDDEELQLSLHLDGQYKTATLPKGLYHAARHSGWKIARHCIIIVFDVINSVGFRTLRFNALKYIFWPSFMLQTLNPSKPHCLKLTEKVS